MVKPMFLCHGAPDIVLEKNEFTELLKDLGNNVKPKAIVIFTAHWESEIPAISSIDGTYEMIYDFYGFPAELYQMKYPAKGSPELAEKVKTLLEKQGIASLIDGTRGIDHGAWTLLSIMYPEAAIPVVQISVNPFRPMQEQYEIGKALQSLGGEDILVIGSGSTVHNLRTLDMYASKPKDWAVAFDDWLIEKVEGNLLDDLFDYQNLAPNVKMAVPREEHIVPLFIAMGAGQEKRPKLLHRSYAFGTLTYLGFEF